MNEYSQGVCEDGAAILKNGQMMTIEEIVAELQERDQFKAQIAVFSKIMGECADDCDGGNETDDDPIPSELWKLWRDTKYQAAEHDAEVIGIAINSINGYMTVSQAPHSQYAKGWNEAIKRIEQYQNQLRQKAQE